MDRIKNGMYMGLRTRQQNYYTKVFRYILAYVEKCFKAYFNIFTHCNKYSEMDICHSGIQNYVSCEK